VALGLIDPNAFAGGSITLKPELSLKALETHVGAPLGLSAEMAAYAVYEMVCENMASAARSHTVERGVVASTHTMIAFGGAAPLHVARVAEKIGAPRVIIPANAGVGSAVGFLAAPVSYEIVKTKYMRLDAFDHESANTLLNDTVAEIMAWVSPAAGDKPIEEKRIAFMRYVGQGHEIPVLLPVRDLTADDVPVIREQYERTYQAMFNRAIPQAAIEIMAWSVSCSTPAELPAEIAAVPLTQSDTPSDLIQIFDGRAEKKIDVKRYKREALLPGAVIAGPAIIVEQETTTYVTASFDAWIDAAGSIVMDKKGVAA